VRVATIGSGGDTTQRYTRTRLHAQGGLGKVWLAKDVSLGREVALKELKQERVSNPRIWSRFVAEAKITGQLEHPSIVPIYELATHPQTGQPYYTMRFIRGKTLAEASKEYDDKRNSGQDDPLAFRTLLNAFVGVCQAVAYAHSRGVLHRDLKGQNVVLGDYGEVIVLDWGLAKLVEASDEVEVESEPAVDAGADHLQTVDGQVLGTPAYMPPEQAAGRLQAVDRQSDIYSLGAILYDLLTGRPPFVGSDTAELLRRVREVEPDRPRSIRSDIAPPLEAIVVRAMAKNPENRYATATELAQDVSRWMADEPVSVYADPWHVKAFRWAKRHRSAVAAIAGVLTVSLVALGVGNYLVSQERDRAKAAQRVAEGTVETFFTEVGEHWLEDHSDEKQEQFLERALAFFDPNGERATPKSDKPTKSSQPTTESDPPTTAPPPLEPMQRQFLESALAYYRPYAQEFQNDREHRLKAALAELRVAQIHRKLGEFSPAAEEYSRAIALLESLHKDAPGFADAERALANARARHGEFLVSRGELAAGTAELSTAVDSLKRLVGQPGASKATRLELGRALRELANGVKFQGDLSRAQDYLRSAIDSLEAVHKDQTNDPQTRYELALACDDLGVVLLALAKIDDAEPLLRRALGLLEPLVTESPTRVAFRDGLAKTANTLALVLRRRGAHTEARSGLTRSIDAYERLAADFPARPEFQRALARGLINRALLDEELGQLSDARAADERAVGVLSRLVDQNQSAFKIRRDLARAHNNLSSLLEQLEDRAAALAALKKAQTLNESLIRQHGELPEFRDSLAICLFNQGRVLVFDGKPQDAMVKLEQSLEIYQKLLTDRPDYPSYLQGLADTKHYLGEALAALEKAPEAEKAMRDAVVVYSGIVEKHPQNTLYKRGLGRLLYSLAEILHPKDQIELARRAVTILEDLNKNPRAPLADRRDLGAARNNLGEYLEAAGKPAEAEALYLAAAADFDATKSEDPTAETQRLGYAAYVRVNLGELHADANETAKADEDFRIAIDAVRTAIKLRPSTDLKRSLIKYYEQLGEVHLKAGDHVAAAALASELTRAVPDLPSARVASFEILAGCLEVLENASSVPEEERNLLARNYTNRAIAQLRAAADAGYKGIPKLKEKPRSRNLLERAELRDLVEGSETKSGSAPGSN
jgi:serine/threonine-protein kinase